jgi:hypothetical protein
MYHNSRFCSFLKNCCDVSSIFIKFNFISFPLLAAGSFLFSSCGSMPSQMANEETGSLEIHSLVVSNGLMKNPAKLATTCDSLIVEIIGPDIGTLRFSRTFSISQPLRHDTLTGIPAGTNREVRVFTIDKAGSTILMDTVSHRSIRIDPNSVTRLTVVLMPAVGSIYLQLENIPTSVDSVVATFTSDSGAAWSVRAKRSTKLYLAIDRIPHNTHGMLFVAAVDTLKDTLYSASKELTFNALSMQNISLVFSTTPGSITLEMTVVLPGVTSVTGNIAAPDSAAVESGALVITEIMYAANDSEYVEVYNPAATDLAFDSLYIEIDGTYRLFTGITVNAGQAFVFGRRMLPWTDTAHAVASALDLSSTGNWVTLRAGDSSVIDRVAFTGGSNPLEWPNVSGKVSIVLDHGVSDAQLNNFGRNWKAATTLISGTTTQYGTPQIR